MASEVLNQHSSLPIRMVTPDFGHLPKEVADKYGSTHRLPYYFFLFILEGSSQQNVDGVAYRVEQNELLFSQPYQIQEFPAIGHGSNYYKLGFDDECLSRLPKAYSFLLDPLHHSKISFTQPAAHRLEGICKMLVDLLADRETASDLILAHLHSFLTEIDTAYFQAACAPAKDGLSRFIGFKLYVENNLTDHPTIKAIAEALAVSTDSLYQIVKEHAGQSPKEFITNRLILEARRRIYNREHSSVKELAFDLGFNDPDYFSRLFKKVTGKTVASFFRDLS